MATEFRLPELGEGIDSAQVVKVLVRPGDTVQAGQPVLELESHKATLELPAPSDGKVEQVLVNDGDEIQVGQVMLTFAADAKAPPAAALPEPAAVAAAAVPESPTAAVPPATAETTPPPKPESAPAPEPGAASAPGIPAAPSVRKFARELGIDIARVTGSGPDGRVSAEDVTEYARRLNEGAARMPAAVIPGMAPLPDFERFGPVERTAMSNIRRATALHLTECWSQIPHVSIFNQADITELDALRRKYAPRAEKLGGKLTMAVMVCKVAAQALRSFPSFNASVDMARKEIVFKKYVNLGIAVSTERGLLVPVIRDADRKNMVQIAVEVSQLAARARAGKLQLGEMEGGTFTVTNLGSIGCTHFAPIINYPEVAILGMGRATTVAGWQDGAWVPRTVLPLSLSFDHRLIDGADGARFLKWIADAIEEPLLLSLEG